MSNANMFVMYSSADGQNMTLSPRTTSGHVMPTHNSAAEFELLEGSGISDGKMIANVRCANCNSWNGGTMSLEGGSSDWLYAHLRGSSLDSDDVNARILQHDGHGTFQWDLSQATGGPDSNPFTGAATTETSSARQNSWERLSSQAQQRLIQAHGTLASIVFVAILPTGAMLVRLASFRQLVRTHAGLQVFAYTIFIAAAGIGIFIANGADYLLEPHAVIGMLLLGVLFFMPFLGAIHHRVYKTVQKRTGWSYGHIFIGRAAVVLGMVNGGLGLQLADARRSYTIAYGVFAGLIGVSYIGAIAFGERKRRMSATALSSAPKESKRVVQNDSGSDASH